MPNKLKKVGLLIATAMLILIAILVYKQSRPRLNEVVLDYNVKTIQNSEVSILGYISAIETPTNMFYLTSRPYNTQLELTSFTNTIPVYYDASKTDFTNINRNTIIRVTGTFQRGNFTIDGQQCNFRVWDANVYPYPVSVEDTSTYGFYKIACDNGVMDVVMEYYMLLTECNKSGNFVEYPKIDTGAFEDIVFYQVLANSMSDTKDFESILMETSECITAYNNKDDSFFLKYEELNNNVTTYFDNLEITNVMQK